MQDIIRLNISLMHSQPKIWREILVHRNSSFFDLHGILQIAMGWNNSHLFEFNVEGYRIGIIEDGEEGYGSNKLLDARQVMLAEIITNVKESFMYVYDFGDHWQHEIKVEEFIAAEAGQKYPTCTGGKMNCPPEDSGGVRGFSEYVAILENKKHPDHKDIVRWFPKNYDAEKFDMEKVSLKLQKLKIKI